MLFEEVAGIDAPNPERPSLNTPSARDKEVVSLVRQSLELNPPPSNRDKSAVFLAWHDVERLWKQPDPKIRKHDIRSVILRRAISIMSYKFESQKFDDKQLDIAVERISMYYGLGFYRKKDVDGSVPALLAEFNTKMKVIIHGSKSQDHSSRNLMSTGHAQWSSEFPGNVGSFLAIVVAILCSITSLGADLLGHALWIKRIKLDPHECEEGHRDIDARFSTSSLWVKNLEAGNVGIIKVAALRRRILKRFKPEDRAEAQMPLEHLDEANMSHFFTAMGADIHRGSRPPTRFTKLHAIFSNYFVNEFFGCPPAAIEDILNEFEIGSKRLEGQVTRFLTSLPPYESEKKPESSASGQKPASSTPRHKLHLHGPT